MNHIVTHSGNIAKIYQTMKGKNKERFEYILEPLQAMVQLGILGYCPVGTKLCIQNNILYIFYSITSSSSSSNSSAIATGLLCTLFGSITIPFS